MNLRTLKDTPPWNWPEGTGKALLGILRDDRGSESDLLLATELAGDVAVINDELVDALLSILRSGDRAEEVRGGAAISLGPVLEHADTEGFEDPDDLPIAERTFHRIQETLRKLYMDASVPKEVRRRILEASVRAPQDWHPDAMRAAYASDDEVWRLTAVFCMRFVRGFDAQILEALDSRNPDLRYEAVLAAGNWEVDAAWPHVAALVTSAKTEKSLRLAAIDAVASIRPHEALELLHDLADSDDEDIADAVHEALAMAEGPSGEHEDDELNDDDEPRR
ncbi:MAG: HEAT repeat domain-containing protein [Candidatus Rokubacteria bacterium]|nr:HEAT repeat domain-containing protein [Candidatus Rokubacteria bacterium]